MLKGKIAVITGGTRGIGYATVKKFLENGATVVLFGSRQETADKAVASLKAENPSWEVSGAWPNLLRPYSVNLILEQNKSDVGSASSLMNMANNALAVVGMLLASLTFTNMVFALGVITLIGTAIPLIAWIALMYSKITINGFYDKTGKRK